MRRLGGLFAFCLVVSLVAFSSFRTGIVRAPPTSEVCIDTLDSMSCPSSPTVFGGSVGDQLTVAVNVFSRPLYSFDVVVRTDPTVLRPTGVAYADTIVPHPLAYALVCIGATNCWSPGRYPLSQGDIELALGCAGCADTRSPPTGRLFEITYNILKNATNKVVLVSIPAATLDQGGPETVEIAAFSSLPAALVLPPPVPPAPVNVVQGTANSSIEIVPTEGFDGNVSLRLVSPPGVECKGLPSTVSLESDTTAEISFSCTSTVEGIYSTNVTATSVATGSFSSALVVFTFADFRLLPFVSSLSIIKGSTANLRVLVEPFSGGLITIFHGMVNFDAPLSPLTNHLPAVTLRSDSGSLPTVLPAYWPGLILNLTVTTTRRTTLGTYVLIVTGTTILGPPVSHAAVVMIKIVPSPEQPTLEPN